MSNPLHSSIILPIIILEFQEKFILESFQKFIKDGIIDEEAEVSFYVEVRGNQLRIGKFFVGND